jgi:hypothetical protein
MRLGRKRVQYKFRHFKIIDGEKVEFNPYEDEALADRCKLAMAYMATGKRYTLVENK